MTPELVEAVLKVADRIDVLITVIVIIFSAFTIVSIVAPFLEGFIKGMKQKK